MKDNFFTRPKHLFRNNYGMKHYELYINGQWVQGDKTRTIGSPYDDKALAQVQWAGEEQVEAALQSAAEAFKMGQSSKTYQRSQWLERIRDGLAKRHDEMTETISEEAGKPISVTRIEVDRGISTFDLASKLAMTHSEEHYPLDIIKYGENRHCLTKRFPIGPVLAITPYNWPLNLGAHKLAPALAVGCPVIMRPASQTPCSSLLLAEIAAEVGLPPGMFNVVPCPVPLAEKMALDDRIKMISFTGSPEVGWALKQKAYQKRVALELGGNAACILEPDTDLDIAIPRLAVGCFAYAGQVCISVQRILVHEAIREEFDQRMLSHLATEFKVGNPREEDTVCGPLIDTGSADKVMAWIEEAQSEGARVMCGGKRRTNNIIEPTLLDNIKHTMRVSCQEVFGPVATVETYRDYDQALSVANDSDFGINCGVFTDNTQKAFKAFEVLDVGCVVINDYPTFRIDRMPYGGVKQSGYGREGVQYTMEEMTEIKGLVLNLNS
jgi:acyl-CoA reductase-like NAD-dependent aldehyde dehydrogenase